MNHRAGNAWLLPALAAIPVLLLFLVLWRLSMLLIRLPLLLRLLLLLGLILLFVLLLLPCICWNGDSKNQRQDSRTNDYDLLHSSYLDSTSLTDACSSAISLFWNFIGVPMASPKRPVLSARSFAIFWGANRDRWADRA